jgi:hypothetical protein
MKRKAKPPFDPKEFLSKVNGGLGLRDYRKAILRMPSSTFRAARPRRPSSPNRARKRWSRF